MVAFANILVAGVFHAAVLFLVAAGLQLVFGAQKSVNPAAGSSSAAAAFSGVGSAVSPGRPALPPGRFRRALAPAGLLLGFVAPPIERLLRTVYSRDESFQLLLTFALV